MKLETPLPKQETIVINETLPTCIYNFYNLDSLWKKDIETNRVLLLEPSHFKKYPIAQKTIDFIMTIAHENISNIQVYVGEFNDLVATYKLKSIHYKEHPLNNHYHGIEDLREWMFGVQGYYPSFFSYWKQCKKELKY